MGRKIPAPPRRTPPRLSTEGFHLARILVRVLPIQSRKCASELVMMDVLQREILRISLAGAGYARLRPASASGRGPEPERQQAVDVALHVGVNHQAAEGVTTLRPFDPT